MTLPPHVPPPYFPPPPNDLKTLYIDDDIILANKPSGLLSVPGRGPEKAICVHSILSDRHGPVLTVHRLDMDTSGLMVFARTKEAHRHLSRSFELRRAEKEYVAVVENQIERDAGEITLPIAKYSLRRPFRHTDPDGQEAITHWQVAARTPATTRLLLSPKTGRTHQLRVHLSAIGHPILGDDLYGNQSLAARLLLHASRLNFPHPASQKIVSFQSEPDF